MATASHEHIPDLSASLSKSHHRAPISDLWGPSLNRKRSTEMASDYAMEIGMDTSRGPLMSSASSAVNHDVLDDAAVVAPSAAEPAAVPISSKVPSGLWSSASPSGPGTPTGPAPGSVAATPGQPSGAQPTGIQLRTLTPNQSYRGSHPVPGHPVPGVNPVAPIGHFRSGIWGPRQNFGSFSNSSGFHANGSVSSVGSSVGSVYAKTPWSVDLAPSSSASSQPGTSVPGMHANGIAVPTPNSTLSSVSPVPSVASSVPSSVGNVMSAGPVPVQPGFYGIPSATVSGSMPSGASPLQNVSGSPQTTPSPPSGMSASRLYQSRPGQPTPPSATSPMQGPTSKPTQVHNHHQQQQQQQQQQHNAQALRNHHHANHDGGAMNGRPPKKNGRPSTNTELYKTELCASYMSTGGHCPYGEKCQFAHGPEELKSVDRPPKWRSKPCQNWVKTGTCSYNERCCFRHDVPVGHNQ